MPARRRFTRRGGKPLHPTKWLSQDFFDTSETTEGTFSVEVVDYLRFADFTNPTVVRIRGQIWVSLTRNDATTSEGIEFAMGIIPVPDTFDNDDMSSLLTQQGAENQWMYYHVGRLQSQLISFALFNSSGSSTGNTSGSYSGPSAFEIIDIDVKAMRRMKPGDSLRLFSTWATSTGAPDFRLSGQLRVLTKE